MQLLGHIQPNYLELRWTSTRSCVVNGKIVKQPFEVSISCFFQRDEAIIHLVLILKSFHGSQNFETGRGGILGVFWENMKVTLSGCKKWRKTTPSPPSSLPPRPYVGLRGLGKAQEARSRGVITGRPPLFYHQPSTYLLLGLIISLDGWEPIWVLVDRGRPSHCVQKAAHAGNSPQCVPPDCDYQHSTAMRWTRAKQKRQSIVVGSALWWLSASGNSTISLHDPSQPFSRDHYHSQQCCHHKLCSITYSTKLLYTWEQWSQICQTNYWRTYHWPLHESNMFYAHSRIWCC